MAPIHVVYATLAALLLTRLPRHANAQAPNPQVECLRAAQASMKQCAESESISHPNFLWFVTNATSSNGAAPSDPDGFKTQICQSEPMVGGCIYNQMVQMVNGSACSQAPQVLQNVQNLLLTYDNKCAHPCRFTLVDELRECYTKVGLDTTLFLNNRTAGQIIGSTEEEVNDYCSKKDALLSCLKPIHDGCPESLPILSSLDFHLPSYEKGVKILCKEPTVYLQGLKCFVEPTDMVEKCVQESQQSFLQANVEAQSQNWTQERFIQESCRVTIKQADCDLKAWFEKKHDACNLATIGLRRELECSLMPPNCTAMQKQLFDEACHHDKFNQDDRDKHGPGDGSDGGSDGSGGKGNGASGMVFLPGALLLAAFVAILFPVMIKI